MHGLINVDHPHHQGEECGECAHILQILYTVERRRQGRVDQRANDFWRKWHDRWPTEDLGTLRRLRRLWDEFQKSFSGGKNVIRSHDDRNEQAHWGRVSVYVCVCACRRVLNASF